ncbi:MAG TPA: DNA-formamidopyrimidine glycosylase family protein [Bryobacteraceae bacterium]|jgi:endonuclease-8|nr:DNA-formamidopyrimidine glycosylase family protein [Bryobacteraceae bacterium]
MPEGNELHWFAERHAEQFARRVVTVAAPNGRFEAGAKQLNRKKLRGVDAYGKHLFYDFGRESQLHIHLGLAGRFRDGDMPFPEPKGALRLRFSTRKHWLELRGPAICEVLDEEGREKVVNRIGPDPLRADADAEEAIRKIQRSHSPIGGLLMNQSVIGGIGNIYRAELLFRAKVNPFRAGKSVKEATIQAIWRDAAVLMREGMRDQKIVTTRASDRPHKRGEARRGETHYVYRRRGLPCVICGTEVEMEEFIGRKVYWCPHCQPAA